MSEANKAVVRRLVEEVLNQGRYDVLEEIYNPAMATAARTWIAPFRDAFPDTHMQVIALIAEGDTVAARFTCSATQHQTWQGHPTHGQRFENVAEVSFFTFHDGRIIDSWSLEDNLDRMQQLGLTNTSIISTGRPTPARRDRLYRPVTATRSTGDQPSSERAASTPDRRIAPSRTAVRPRWGDGDHVPGDPARQDRAEAGEGQARRVGRVARR